MRYRTLPAIRHSNALGDVVLSQSTDIVTSYICFSRITPTDFFSPNIYPDNCG